MPWVKHRAATEQRNLRQRGVERDSQANISAARQRRIDDVKRRFECGESPTAIAKAMGHKHVHVYHDLRAAGIEVSKSDQKINARVDLQKRVQELLNTGLQFNEIASELGVTLFKVRSAARKLGIDGRSRPESRRHFITPNRDEIIARALELDDGRPRREIAEELGVNYYTLNSWLEDGGHRAPRRGIQKREQIKELLQQGKTYVAIHAAIGASKSTIAAVKKEML
jgi:DNA invertase Pin-like site-specific DNA recombinase